MFLSSTLENGNVVQLYGLRLELGPTDKDPVVEELKKQITTLQQQINLYVDRLHRQEGDGSSLASQQNIGGATELLDWAGLQWKIIAKYEVLELLLDTNNRIKTGDADDMNGEFAGLGFVDHLTKQSSHTLSPVPPIAQFLIDKWTLKFNLVMCLREVTEKLDTRIDPDSVEQLGAQQACYFLQKAAGILDEILVQTK